MIQAALSSPHILSESITEGNEPDVLNNVWSQDYGLAVYRRQLGVIMQDWIDSIPANKLPKARISLQKDQVKPAMVAVFEEYGISDDPCSQLLADDINTLAHFFAEIMKVNSINLRLDVVSNNACRKFHQDNVAARLLCTYRGRGTEYGVCLTRPEPDEIHELPRGSVGLFKGRRWPEATPSAIYHRSPQIEGSGETRLLLVIDSASCADNCSCGEVTG